MFCRPHLLTLYLDRRIPIKEEEEEEEDTTMMRANSRRPRCRRRPPPRRRRRETFCSRTFCFLLLLLVCSFPFFMRQSEGRKLLFPREISDSGEEENAREEGMGRRRHPGREVVTPTATLPKEQQLQQQQHRTRESRTRRSKRRRILLETDEDTNSIADTTSTTNITDSSLYSATNPLNLFGAGATFPAVAYKSCARAYALIKPSVRVSYLDVGSGKGICRILNATTECTDTEEPLEVDFACSDSLISASQYTEFPDVQMYPVVAGAVTPVYNLPEIDSATGKSSLVLTKETLSLIYAGVITKWNDNRIKSANQASIQSILPDENILVSVRKDSSGTTEAWTKALSQFSNTFKNNIGASKLPSWGTHIANSVLNELDTGYGLASFVRGNEYSIGYVVLSDAMNLQLSMIGLLESTESTSNPVYADSDSITSAILQKGLQFGNNEDESMRITADLMGADDPGAWPIATYSYLILRKGMNSTSNTALDRLRVGATCDNMRETLDFWSWFLTSPLTKTVMETNSLVQVPAVVRNFVLARMQGDLFCEGDRLASLYDDEINSLDNVTMVKVHGPQEVATVLDSLSILISASNSSMGLEITPLGTQDAMFTALDDSYASVLALNYVKDEASSGTDPQTSVKSNIFSNAETPVYTSPLPSDFPEYISFPFVKITPEMTVHPSVLTLGETSTSIAFDIFSVGAILSGRATTWGDETIVRLNPWLSGVTEPIVLVGLDDWSTLKTYETIEKKFASSVPDFTFSRSPTKSAVTLNEVGALVVANDYATALLLKTAYVTRNQNLVLHYALDEIGSVPISVTLRRSYSGAQCSRSSGAYDKVYAQLRFWEWVYTEDDVPGMISSVTAEPNFDATSSAEILTALRSITCDGKPILVSTIPVTRSDQNILIVVMTSSLFALLFIFLWLFRFREDAVFAKGFFERYKKRNAPPSEACTIVVTDIQSSTKLWEIAPVTMNKALAAHDLLIRQEMQKFYGYEVFSEGDSFTMAFHTPGDALKACANIQNRLQSSVWDRSLFLACRHIYRTDDAESQSTIPRPRRVPTFLRALLEERGFPLKSLNDREGIIKEKKKGEMINGNSANGKDNSKAEGTDHHSGRTEEEEEIINGLRVRMGIHTGNTHRYVHPTTRRHVYEGKTVELARLLCHAANGGQILMSGDVLAAFGPDSLQISQMLQLMHMGKHQLDMGYLNRHGILNENSGPGGEEGVDNGVDGGDPMQNMRESLFPSDANLNNPIFLDSESDTTDGSSEYEQYKATTSAKLQALRRMITSYDHKIISQEIIQAIPKKLVERITLFAPIKTVRQLEPSIFEAPVFESENLTVVFTRIEGWEELGREDVSMRDKATAQHDAVIRSTLLSFRGYECRGGNGKFFIAFHHPFDAFRWCLVVQTILLRVPWDEKLLQQPQACNMTAGHRVTFKGLRVTMGVVSGEATYMKPCQRTGRAEYFGQVLNLSARVAGLAHGGQILCDKNTWKKAASVGFPYEHSRYIGLYSLRGIMDPVGLVQVSDASLNMRSFASVKGAQKVIDPTDKFRLSTRDLETERIDRPLSYIGDGDETSSLGRSPVPTPPLPLNTSLDGYTGKSQRSKNNSPRISSHGGTTGMDSRASDTSSANGGGESPDRSSAIIVPKKNILLVSSSDIALYRMAALVEIVAGGYEHVFISRSKTSADVLKKFSSNVDSNDDMLGENLFDSDYNHLRDSIPSVVIIVGTIESGTSLRDLVQKIRRRVPFTLQPKIAVLLTDESSVIDGVASSPVEYGADVELPPLLFVDEDAEMTPLVDELNLLFNEANAEAHGSMRSSSRNSLLRHHQQHQKQQQKKLSSDSGDGRTSRMNAGESAPSTPTKPPLIQVATKSKKSSNNNNNNNNNFIPSSASTSSPAIINPLSNLLREAENKSKNLSNFASANLMVAGLEATGLPIFAVDTDARIILCTKKGFARGISGTMIFPSSSFSKRMRDSARIAERTNPPPPWTEKLTKNWIPLDEDETYNKTASMSQPTSPEKKTILKRMSSSSVPEQQQQQQQQEETITVRCTPLRLSDDFGAVLVLIRD